MPTDWNPDDWLHRERERHLEELKDFLRIPSVSTDPAHASDVARCARWLRDRCEEAGLVAEVHATPGHPVVYAEWLNAPGAPTVLIYGHYDVQPADPLELWRNPPFEPVIEDGTRIVARGATDDKGQMYCHVKAVEALLATSGTLPVNVKMIFEGEEEVGSRHLDAYLEENRDRLAADIVLISDTSMFARGRPMLTVGLRGLSYVEVHVRGASHDLHSGLFGGGVANPALGLARMLGGLLDESGRVTVPGFYDRVRDLPESERREMAALGHDESALREEIGVTELVGEAGWTALERMTVRPTVDVNGLWGGYTGAGAKTVLPAEAHAKVSCRLVPDQDPEEVTAMLAAYFRERCPAGLTVDVDPHHGGVPFRIDRDTPELVAVSRALERVWGVAPVLGHSGGSIPVVASFVRLLGLPSVLMGFGLEDDRLHSPNEKFELENYWQGIRSAAWALIELSGGR
ncbi:MAG: dipeptidase [Deltaproteobacteria bacterium]|nr:MAG: dipeptidase [Deltaproteobacteria bacterium]